MNLASELDIYEISKKSKVHDAPLISLHLCFALEAAFHLQDSKMDCPKFLVPAEPNRPKQLHP